MNAICDCEDGAALNSAYPELFVKDAIYGWGIKWIVLTEDKGYTKIHRYALKIYHCPMCGKKIVDK